MKAYLNILIVLGVVGLLSAVIVIISPRLFYFLLGISGSVLLILSALVMVVTFRKAKSLSPMSYLISIGMSLILVVFYTILSKTNVGTGILILSMLCGMLIGIGWGLSNSLFVESGAIKMRGNAWYLLVWAVIFATTQLLSLITGRPPAVGLILLYTGTGLVVGNSGLILTRYFRLKFKVTT